MASSKISQRARPFSLARYSAVSASRRSDSGVDAAPAAGASARPMLVVTTNSRPSRVKGRASSPESLRDDVEDLLLGRQLLADQDELVAAHPGQRVRGPQQGRRRLGDSDEELVAGGVAHAVVDPLEAVEVHEDDGDAGRDGWSERARSSRSSSSARLGRPVRASCRAWCASASSATFCSVMSWTVPRRGGQRRPARPHS